MKNKKLIVQPWIIYAFFGSIFFFPIASIHAMFTVALIVGLGTLEKWSDIKTQHASIKAKYLAHVSFILILIIGNVRYGFSESTIAKAIGHFHWL